MALATPADLYIENVARAQAAVAAYYDTDTELMSDAEYDELLTVLLRFVTANQSHAGPCLNQTAPGRSTRDK